MLKVIIYSSASIEVFIVVIVSDGGDFFMNELISDVADVNAVLTCVGEYIEGAREGSLNKLCKVFHHDATIFGYVGAESFCGHVNKLYDWVGNNEPADDLQANIVSVELVKTMAVVRLELDNWGGGKFTDILTLLKSDGVWLIAHKIFHLHL